MGYPPEPYDAGEDYAREKARKALDLLAEDDDPATLVYRVTDAWGELERLTWDPLVVDDAEGRDLLRSIAERMRGFHSDVKTLEGIARDMRRFAFKTDPRYDG